MIVKKLYIFISLLLCTTVPFSAISQEEGGKKEKSKKEKKAVSPNFKHKFTTFHLEARADFEYNGEFTKWDYPGINMIDGFAEQHRYGFRGDYFNFLLGGDIGDHIT